MWLQQSLQVLKGGTNVGSLLPLASLGTLNSAENCLFLLLLQLHNFDPSSLTDNMLCDHRRKCLSRFNTALFFQNNLLMLVMIEQPSIRANEPVVNKILKVSRSGKIMFQVGILKSIIS